MSEARQAVAGFLKELAGVLADLVAGAGSWGVDKARDYLAFLRRAGFAFLIIAGILIVALFAAVIAQQDWLIAATGLLIGIATAAILVLATPLGTLAVLLGRAVEPVKAFLRFVGGILLWALLLTLYFSIVPISDNPRAIFLVTMITFIVALFWAVYGISPSPHRIYASVVSVFLITTISLFFPKTFAATIGLRVRLDEKLATCLTSLSTCFSRHPPGGEKLGGVELPTVQDRRVVSAIQGAQKITVPLKGKDEWVGIAGFIPACTRYTISSSQVQDGWVKFADGSKERLGDTGPKDFGRKDPVAFKGEGIAYVWLFELGKNCGPSAKSGRRSMSTARRSLAKEQEPGGAQWQEAPEIPKQREPKGAMKVEVPQPRSEPGGAAYQPLPQERPSQSGGASYQALPSSPPTNP